MKLQRYWIILVCLVLMSTTLSAQKMKLRRANKLFSDLNYTGAIEVYKDLLDKRDNSEAKMKLAEAYRKVGNMQEAEYWLGQVVLLPDCTPEQKLHYGMALQYNGKCDMAQAWFTDYLEEVPNDMRARLLSKACDKETKERLFTEGEIFKVTHLPKINSEFDDFGPAYYKEGIIFSSERDRGAAVVRTHTWTGRPFLELFYSRASLLDEFSMEHNYSDPEKYNDKLNTRFHDGPISFSADQSEIYFTRNNVINGKVGKDDNGVIRLKIFTSKEDGNGGWGEIKGVPFNSDEYSVAHPSLSPDGKKLFFSTDLPGGFGGMDIYVTYFENDRWAPPVNLGPIINTEGNEVFPYFHSDGNLYFSSDGHTGLGGLDIYMTDDKSGGWSPVQNLGYPVNTKADDFGLIMNEARTHGYFTSNREGGLGLDDIYSFSRLSAEIEVLVYDKNTGEPVVGAEVTSPCSNKIITTGSNGRAIIELPLDKRCDFLASRETYKEGNEVVSTQGYEPGAKIILQVPLDRDLTFDLTGKVTDERTGRPLAGAKIVLENDCGDDVQTIFADAEGNYTYNLRDKCCYLAKISQDSFLTNTVQFCTRGKKKSEVLSGNIALNQFILPYGPLPTFVLEHIYYDFDKAFIREDASAGLQNLLTLLQNNPGIIVEIGSHTDSRGPNRYNKRLSTRRAEAVVRYLIQKGISKKRLVYKGYGEDVIVNGCYNLTPCTEEQHQKNRRTEFKVIGTVNGVLYSDGIKSQQPVQVKTDPCKGCPF